MNYMRVSTPALLILHFAFCFSAAGTLAAERTPDSRRPNIVLIMADDI